MSSIKIVVATIVCSVLTFPANAEGVSGRKSTSINSEGASATYVKKKMRRTFRITGKTVFRLGEKAGSLSDLKRGQPATIEFLRQDASFTALLVGVGF